MGTQATTLLCERATLRVRLILLWGVTRRFFLNVFCRRHVRRSLDCRAGECKRCGVCCHLVANKCGALHLHKDGHSTCRLYSVYRLPNCCTFPIDPRDIADRDLVSPETTCGYYWPE
jgi:hypothetical protein